MIYVCIQAFNKAEKHSQSLDLSQSSLVTIPSLSLE